MSALSVSVSLASLTGALFLHPSNEILDLCHVFEGIDDVPGDVVQAEAKVQRKIWGYNAPTNETGKERGTGKLEDGGLLVETMTRNQGESKESQSTWTGELPVGLTDPVQNALGEISEIGILVDSCLLSTLGHLGRVNTLVTERSFRMEECLIQLADIGKQHQEAFRIRTEQLKLQHEEKIEQLRKALKK